MLKDIAHLGHCELLTPRMVESYKFFTDILGLTEVYREDKSIYLRCWGDYEEYSLILTKSDQAGVAHTAFRTMSAEALERKAKEIEESGQGIGWVNNNKGHGKAYRFYGPDGHILELYYETKYYEAPNHLKSAYKNLHQKNLGVGVAVKKFDHINFLSSNPAVDGDYLENTLGLQLTEQIKLNNGERPTVWYRMTNKSYDVVYAKDNTGSKGRLHHLAFSVDTNEAIWKAADLFVENGVFIEFAPSKHAINQTYFVYVYEPGGNRIEICSGGYLIFAPDWKPITWTEEDRKKGQAWGNKTVSTFHTYGTPVLNETTIESEK